MAAVQAFHAAPRHRRADALDDATHYRGGSTHTDGVDNLNRQSNDRIGLTLAVPVNRSQSLKINVNSGVSTRTGTDFDTLGVAWQYRWGAQPAVRSTVAEWRAPRPKGGAAHAA